jgi:hypothetical protein
VHTEKPRLGLARDLRLPLEAVTQTFGFVGKRGSGKTYGALKLGELFLVAGGQVVALDPVGKWWSLRLAADGKGKGFEIPVLGGHRGDLPLEPGSGALVADLVVDRRASLVLDVSLMTQGELKRFARDFGERLLQRKKGEAQPTPLHLFMEEAQEVVPERAQGEDERMKAAFVRLVKLGRNWGIGVTLVTQRPQAVSKEALNQTECLVALQTVGAHERKALREWIAHHGEQEKLVDLLPALHSGEAYVWSPSWLGLLQRVKIAPRTTFDASATPTMASARTAAAAAPLGRADLEALRASMAEVVRRAEEDDPKALRQRVRDLEASLAKNAPAEPDRARLATEWAKGSAAGAAQTQKHYAAVIARVEAKLGRIARTVEDAQTALAKVQDLVREPVDVGELPAAAPRATESRSAPRSEVVRGAQDAPAASAAKVDQPMQRVLDALAWLEMAGLSPPFSREQVAFLARYSPSSSSFANALGRLSTAQFVSYPTPGSVAATDSGRDAAHPPERASNAEELQTRVFKRIDGPMQRCLDPLLAAFPYPLSREKLAEAADYSAASSSFANALGRLHTVGCVWYPTKGYVVARGWLFLEAE